MSPTPYIRWVLLRHWGLLHLLSCLHRRLEKCWCGFFGFLSTKPSKFYVLVSSILTFTCLFYCSSFSASMPTKLLILLLLHSLKHVSLGHWSVFFMYFKISCAVSHLQLALPSQHHFSSLFLFCNVSIELLSTQWEQLLDCKQIFFFSAKCSGPSCCFWTIKVNCNHFQSGLKENEQT